MEMNIIVWFTDCYFAVKDTKFTARVSNTLAVFLFYLFIY